MSSMPTVHADMVNEFYKLIANDSKLKTNFPGLTVDKVLDRRAVATTPPGGIGNLRVAISQERAGRFQWNCGPNAGQQPQDIKIDIYGKVLANDKNSARDNVDAIKRRIADLLLTTRFFGTGWLSHTQVDDGYPSAPVKTMAYNYLKYECLVTYG